jgi:hypothetical protein
MIDFIITAVIVLFAAILAFDSFRKWRATKSLWYILASGVSVLAAIGAVVSWSDGIYAIILAVILRFIAGFVGKPKS